MEIGRTESFYSDFFAPQSRAKCSEKGPKSVSCPGEREQMESGRHEFLQIAGSQTTKMGASKASTENWTERFQDLQSWCHQPPQDELHTPQINDHDEFNFSVDVANVKDLDDESFVDTDPWGTTDLFETSCLQLEENNNNENFADTKDLFNVMFGNSTPTNAKSPLKPSSENIMLAQNTQSPVNAKNYTLQSDYVMDQNDFNHLLDISNIKNPTSFKVPKVEGNKERRKLKLNIAAATSSKASLLSALSTPDVLKPVTEVQGEFDLVEFVDPGEEFEDFLSESHEVDSVENDHNYTSPKSTDWQIKTEPLSPPQSTEDDTVTTESGRKVKRPRKTSESDFVFDSDDLSDDSFTPTPKKKKTARRTSLKSESSYDPSDKYRELRDRNNEASRKSRQHRKERDEQMRRQEQALEKLNRQLKIRTKRMEELVFTMRAYNLNFARSRNPA